MRHNPNVPGSLQWERPVCHKHSSFRETALAFAFLRFYPAQKAWISRAKHPAPQLKMREKQLFFAKGLMRLMA
jgi:hypothetical protein